MADPRLGRIAQFDDRSRNFPVRAALTADQQTPKTKLWTLPAGAPVLDQGAEGACVGFGVTNELRFNPVPVAGLSNTTARNLYWAAQRLDGFPGGSYAGADPVQEGSSVLAGIKVAAKQGYYKTYRWAFGEADLALAVSNLGPAVIGVNWHQTMSRPDRNGYLKVAGDSIGGHCVLVVGIDTRYGYYTIYNSWGPTWGKKGIARIRRPDMARLLKEDGDACIITERCTPTPQPTASASAISAPRRHWWNRNHG